MRIQKIIKFLKIAVFIAIIVGIPLIVFLRYPDFGQILTNQDAFSAFLAEHEGQNAVIYIAVAFVTTILGIIPSQIIHLAGGFVFGTALAFGLTAFGTAIGTFTAFLLARHFGKEFVLLIFKEKNIDSFVEMMNTGKAYIVIVFVFLIPGIPKDVFTYAAGLTRLRVLPFTLTAAISRSPAQLATLLIAGFIRTGNYIGIICVVAVVAAFLVFLLFRRKSFFAFLEKIGSGLTTPR